MTYLTWQLEPTEQNIRTAVQQFQATTGSTPKSIRVNPKNETAVAMAVQTGQLKLPVQPQKGCLKFEFWLEV